jgi:hypothetical protein
MKNPRTEGSRPGAWPYSDEEQGVPNTSALTWKMVTTPDPRLGGNSPLALFETRVQLAGDFGCWHWTGYLSSGYGFITVRGERHSAHRFSYVVHRGPIPEGLTLDHLCRVTRCVNPWHVEPVTPSVNSRRAVGFQGPGWRRRKPRRRKLA